jgi:hypothetical protein
VPGTVLTIEQRRALQLLAEAPNRYTEAALRARGLTPTIGADVRPNWIERDLTGAQLLPHRNLCYLSQGRA